MKVGYKVSQPAKNAVFGPLQAPAAINYFDIYSSVGDWWRERFTPSMIPGAHLVYGQLQTGCISYLLVLIVFLLFLCVVVSIRT